MFHKLQTKLSTSLAVALILAVLLAPLALADNIQGDDLETGGNTSKWPGQSGTATFRLVANGNDGCNVDLNDSATATVVSNQSWLMISSPGSISFTACGVYVDLGYSISPSAPIGGVAQVSVSAVSGGKEDNNGWNLNPSSFNVTVIAPPPPSDTTPPVITWNSDIEDDNEFYFGFVPAEPTCTAEDDVDGEVECTVTGYSTEVGGHTLEATASDSSGNVATDTRNYTVLAWTLTGFYQPVDMDGVLNTVKGGSTVPLKFNVFAGDLELTDTSIIASFTTTQYVCDGSQQETLIEVTTTGNTSLRYDEADGQFIQNWKTPKLPGKCFLVTMTTQDGSTLVADFKLK